MDRDGRIVTNNHVVADATDVETIAAVKEDVSGRRTAC